MLELVILLTLLSAVPLLYLVGWLGKRKWGRPLQWIVSGAWLLGAYWVFHLVGLAAQ